MKNIIIFGGPGSGKGTQSERIIKQYGLHHISTGEVLRRHIANGDELGKTANEYISKGHLIPDELMIQVLENVLDSNPDVAKNGVIFDGFPRTIEQAEALNRMLERRGSKIHAVIGLEVPDDELVKRMIERGQTTGRADDNEDTIRERLNVYHKQTSPLRDYYIEKKKYHKINGTCSIDDVYIQIENELKNIPE